MDIYSTLASKPHNAHYLKRYYKFILACCQVNLSLPEGTYAEKHHICPKANDLFPGYKDFRSNKWNKAVLTARQHFIAHWMLWKAYGGSQSQAFYLMCNLNGKKITSSIYENLSELYADNVSKRLKGTSIYKDSNGKTFRASIYDERITTGEITSANKGRMLNSSTYVDKNGNFITCGVDDPRVTSGELIHNNVGRKQSKDTIKKKIDAMIDKNLYTFQNIYTLEKLTMTRQDMTEYIGMKIYNLFRTKGTIDSAKGWLLEKDAILRINALAAIPKTTRGKRRRLKKPIGENSSQVSPFSPSHQPLE